jgi:hypothetical protein
MRTGTPPKLPAQVGAPRQVAGGLQLDHAALNVDRQQAIKAPCGSHSSTRSGAPQTHVFLHFHSARAGHTPVALLIEYVLDQRLCGTMSNGVNE